MPFVDWDTGASPDFEGTPAGGNQISEGDDRIRELKENIRLRGDVEHDWSGDVAGGYNDTGRHNPGSARAFFQTAAPTGLQTPDGSAGDDTRGTGAAFTAADSGRLWFDSDSSPANRLQVWDGAALAWEEVDVATAASATTATEAEHVPDGLDSEGSTTASTNVLASATVIALSPGNPAVTIPASRDYEILVEMVVHVLFSAQRSLRLWVEEDIDGGGFAEIARSVQHRDTIFSGRHFTHMASFRSQVLATAGSTYSYRLVCQTNIAGSIAVNSGGSVAGPVVLPSESTRTSLRVLARVVG